MYLWVGLGNPGSKYEKTRHNIGAIILAEMFQDVNYKIDKSFNSIKGEIIIDNEKHIIIYPQTYMNLSGDAVTKALKYYSIKPENMLVFHDEIEMSPGTVSYKFGGGHRGHNGLRDIINKISTADFHRIRIGVGRPEHGSVADYVLSRIPDEDYPDISIIKNLVNENFIKVELKRK